MKNFNKTTLFYKLDHYCIICISLKRGQYSLKIKSKAIVDREMRVVPFDKIPHYTLYSYGCPELFYIVYKTCSFQLVWSFKCFLKTICIYFLYQHLSYMVFVVYFTFSMYRLTRFKDDFKLISLIILTNPLCFFFLIRKLS